MYLPFKKPVLVFFLWASFVPSFAQDTQTHNFGLPVTRIVKADRQHFTLHIGHGLDLNIEAGQEVSIWGVLRDEEKNVQLLLP